MRKTLLTVGAVLLCSTIISATALAQGASSVAPGRNQDAWTGHYDVDPTNDPFGAGTGEPTGSPTPGGAVSNLGGAISGGFYGNTSNAGIDGDAPTNGHGVTPSISPGPQTVGGDGPGTGTSIGDFIQDNRP